MTDRTATFSFFVMLCIIAWQGSLVAEDKLPALSVSPDSDVQTSIDRLARARPGTPEFYGAVQEMYAQVHNRAIPKMEEHLLLQAAYYAAHAHEENQKRRIADAKLSSTRILPTVVRELEIPKTRALRTLIPYLNSDDERLSRAVRMYIATPPPQTENNIEILLSYISDKPSQVDPPWEVVKIVYFIAPKESLERFAYMWLQRKDQLDRKKAILWGEQAVSDVIFRLANGVQKPDDVQLAVAELDKLSQFDEWWVRLYVAEMLRLRKEFRDERIVNRLQKDSIPLVVKWINAPGPEDAEEPTTEKAP